MDLAGKLSLSALIDVLQSDTQVIGPATMQDILERLAVLPDEAQGHTVFSEARLPIMLTFEHQAGEGAPLFSGERRNYMVGGAMQYGARRGTQG